MRAEFRGVAGITPLRLLLTGGAQPRIGKHLEAFYRTRLAAATAAARFIPVVVSGIGLCHDLHRVGGASGTLELLDTRTQKLHSQVPVGLLLAPQHAGGLQASQQCQLVEPLAGTTARAPQFNSREA